MTTQAQNSINLYKGNPVSMIKQALKMQRASIIDELKDHFGVSTIDDLAVRLSMN